MFWLILAKLRPWGMLSENAWALLGRLRLFPKRSTRSQLERLRVERALKGCEGELLLPRHLLLLLGPLPMHFRGSASFGLI